MTITAHLLNRLHKYSDSKQLVLLNPILIVEVLSESTQSWDLHGKFDLYRAVPSLQVYLLLWQDQVRAELRTRVDDLVWQMRVYMERADVIRIDAVACDVPLAEVYADVVFDAPPSGPHAEQDEIP
jgi:Uma2 family endonuclease